MSRPMHSNHLNHIPRELLIQCVGPLDPASMCRVARCNRKMYEVVWAVRSINQRLETVLRRFELEPSSFADACRAHDIGIVGSIPIQLYLGEWYADADIDLYTHTERCAVAMCKHLLDHGYHIDAQCVTANRFEYNGYQTMGANVYPGLRVISLRHDRHADLKIQMAYANPSIETCSPAPAHQREMTHLVMHAYSSHLMNWVSFTSASGESSTRERLAPKSMSVSDPEPETIRYALHVLFPEDLEGRCMRFNRASLYPFDESHRSHETLEDHVKRYVGRSFRPTGSIDGTEISKRFRYIGVEDRHPCVHNVNRCMVKFMDGLGIEWSE